MFAGLMLTLLIGLFWTVTGICYKLIARWGLSIFNISLATGTFSLLTVLLFLTDVKGFITGTVPLPGTGYVLFIYGAGAANMGGSLILQRSMLYGRSGVTWALGQSALIVPFLTITLLFREVPSPVKVAGTLLVLSGMFFLAMKSGGTGEDAPRPRYGIFLALCAFCVLGTAQSMTASSSFFTYRDPGTLRPLLVAAGSLTAAAAGKFLLKDRGFRLNRKALLLILVLAVQGALALWLQFRALDKLKEAGMNGLFFPLAVGTCIAGYALFSVLAAREKGGSLFFAGVSVILAGILCYCFA